jgi:hypothetical protein
MCQSRSTTTRREAGEGEDGAVAAHRRWLRKGGGGDAAESWRTGRRNEPWLGVCVEKTHMHRLNRGWGK